MEKKKSNKSTVTLPNATVFTDKRNPLTTLFKNRAFFLVVLIIVVATAATGGYMLYKRHKDTTGTRVVCADSLLKTASYQYSQGAVSQLELTIGQIKALAKYTRDPNCMYAITEYQIVSGDIDAAKKSISDLKQTYGSFKFSKGLDNGSPSIDNLQKQLDVMQNAVQNEKGSINPDI